MGRGRDGFMGWRQQEVTSRGDLLARIPTLLILYKEILFPGMLINPQICRHLTYAGN